MSPTITAQVKNLRDALAREQPITTEIISAGNDLIEHLNRVQEPFINEQRVKELLDSDAFPQLMSALPRLVEYDPRVRSRPAAHTII